MRAWCVFLVAGVLAAQASGGEKVSDSASPAHEALAMPVRTANVQARLLRASPEKTETEPKLQDIEPKLRRQFGFPYYYLLGSQDAPLVPDKVLRFDLGKGFVVFVKYKGPIKKSHRLEIEWYSGKVSLLRTLADIDPRATLRIKGPDVGRDWIILALTVAS